VPLISGKSYRVVCGIALGSLCVIVFTGALVRLTNSGLGCSDWPNCNNTKFVDISSSHTAIEQLNRLFTGVVSFSVIAAVLMSHLRRPKRSDLIFLSWSLVGGVVAQIVIGGIVVLTGLNPFANMAHFLVSMILIACAFTLFRRSATEYPVRYFRSFTASLSRLVWMSASLGLIAIVTGTVVTATGPHAGDENAVRFKFELTTVARIHSVTVILFIVFLAWTAIQTRKHQCGADTSEAVNTLLLVAVFQGAIGYTQYFTGVPVTLVAAHIIGAISLFLSLCHLLLAPRDAVEPTFISSDF
jgi:cytochrome c oxidase assembly protein subunit 15